MHRGRVRPTNDNDDVAQHGGRTSANTKSWFPAYVFDIWRPYYDQLAPVKTTYPLTSITWPYSGLRVIAHKGHVFLKLAADQVLVFDWIAGSCQVVIRGWAGLFGNWVNANPGLKVNRSINLSSTQVFFTALGSWCSLRLSKIKTEGQK